MTNFGQFLRNLRNKKDMTVNQLAMYSGVSAAAISRIENGKRGVPKPETIRKIAEALKVPYEELMEAAGYLPEENPSSSQKQSLLNDPELNIAFYDGYDELSPEEQEAVKEIVKNTIETFKKMKAERANKK
ncbi:helix-turn-helix domain-containing protein [Aneurinibacillus migulanus]|uniref:helix-turn-helix domain-containing protein n=1 Tax=Aneurinibacillus migulanus TaxID=47500 RepID=UPI0023DF2E87|nr:helix-turn-helix transcriptional regulator [Aneurinibacillus migulanus]